MLWKSATSGEDLFLLLHKKIGGTLDLSSRTGIGLDALVSPEDFSEFVQLTATMEIFFRCVRSATSYMKAVNNPSANELASAVRRDIDLPGHLGRDRMFSEHLLRTGRIAYKTPRDKRVEQAAMDEVGMRCYMCGIALTRRGSGNGRDKYTIEHLWPLSFGGETIEGNLIPACANCNNRRKHMLSWAWGPVQSTYLHPSESPSNELKLSLGLARLLHFAKSGKHPKTLKETALRYQPLQTELTLEQDKHHLYYELMQQVRIS